jgi:hypothetical protein
MDEKELLKVLLRNTIALSGAMRESVSSATGDRANLGNYASFKTFMRKYNLLAKEAAPMLSSPAMLDTFDLTKIRESGGYPWPQQKVLFDHVFTNVSILRSLLEGAIGFAEDATQNLKDFIQANLRRVVYEVPQKETEVQNNIETLLVGRGMAKGIDFDRETGRVKTSGKESIPDFIFSKLNLCLEVKLSKSKDDLRGIVDQINADILTYGTKYERQIYVVYDLATIKDEAEFKKDIENIMGVSVVIVKH